VISDPSESSKLIFDNAGLCKIYEYKGGQNLLRKIMRYVTFITFVNGILFGLEAYRPMFGKLNMISFGLVTGTGYLMLSVLQVYSRRIVHRMHLSNDFQTVHIEFYNAFWVEIALSRNRIRFHLIFRSFRNHVPASQTSPGSNSLVKARFGLICQQMSFAMFLTMSKLWILCCWANPWEILT